MSLRALCKTEGLALGFSKALDTRRAVYISEEVKGAYPKLVQLICDMCVSEKNSWTLVANKIAFQNAKTKASGFPSQSSKAGFLLCQVLNHGPPCAQQHSDRGGEKLAKQNQNEGEAPRSNQDTNTDTDTHRHTDTQTHRHTDTHTHTHTAPRHGCCRAPLVRPNRPRRHRGRPSLSLTYFVFVFSALLLSVLLC